jgi:hypothetical protein
MDHAIGPRRGPCNLDADPQRLSRLPLRAAPWAVRTLSRLTLRAALKAAAAALATLTLLAGTAAVPLHLAAQTSGPAGQTSGHEPGQAPAQALIQVPPQVIPSDTLMELRLVDGSTLIGRIVAVEDDRITFETATGVRVEFARDQIRSLVPARGSLVDGHFWPEDPNRTRLLAVSPTGRSLPKGEGYLSAFWIFFPFVGYGMTDNFTLSAGTPVIPEVIGRVIYLAPKLRVLGRENMNVAVGVLALLGTEALDEGSVGIFYGVGTFGSPDHSLTAGAGWAYAWGGGDPWVSNEPLIMVGGEHRVGPRTKLLTENFFVPGESGALLTGGMRLFGERLSVDFGIGLTAGFDSDGTPWFPLLNFVWNFGGGR